MSGGREGAGFWKVIYVSYRDVAVFSIGMVAALALGAMLGPAFNNFQLSACKPPGHLSIGSVVVSADSSSVSLRTGVLGREIAYFGVHDTHSMQPVIGGNSTIIEFVPQDPSDIKVCDIVGYGGPGEERWGLHRIVEIGQDEEGTYYVTKGDNNLVADGKVRFKDIHYVVLAVVY